MGYLELGMVEDAEQELIALEPGRAGEREVLILWLELWSATARWNKAVEVARTLAQMEPDEADWQIRLAYSTRRAFSILDAEKILREAMERFPKESLIVYNLACYACQLGRMDEARRLLRKAFEMNPTHYRGAHEDDDLKPLKAEFALLLSGGEGMVP